MKARFGIAALVLAISGLLVSSQAYSAGDSSTQYTLTIKKVDVKKTKADGSAWDIMDGAPDLFVRVSNDSVKDSKAFDTKVHDDIYTTDFNTPTSVRFNPGQTLFFEVYDKDIAANDLVGKVTCEMTEKVIKQGKIRLENFGQVIYLDIEVKKL